MAESQKSPAKIKKTHRSTWNMADLDVHRYADIMKSLAEAASNAQTGGIEQVKAYFSVLQVMYIELRPFMFEDEYVEAKQTLREIANNIATYMRKKKESIPESIDIFHTVTMLNRVYTIIIDTKIAAGLAVPLHQKRKKNPIKGVITYGIEADNDQGENQRNGKEVQA